MEEFRVDAARKMREIPSLKMALERTQSELQASTTELALRNKCLSAKDETIAVLMNKLRDANEDIEQCKPRKRNFYKSVSTSSFSKPKIVRSRKAAS